MRIYDFNDLKSFQLLTSARERSVPSTRFGRLVSFGGLGLGDFKIVKSKFRNDIGERGWR
jgi:hypothetical protein